MVREVITLMRMQRRLLLTKGRIGALGALAGVVVLLAAITSNADDPPTAAFQLIRSVGLAGLVPIELLAIWSLPVLGVLVVHAGVAARLRERIEIAALRIVDGRG